MNDIRNKELLQIYRIHAELADKVSQRREGANRSFVSLLVGLMFFLGIVARFGSDGISVDIILLFAGLMGTVLSVSWYVVIRSYRQLNTGKFHVLHELEQELAFPFFEKEWTHLQSSENSGRYWKLTIVETSLPIFFLVLSLTLAIIGLFRLL